MNKISLAAITMIAIAIILTAGCVSENIFNDFDIETNIIQKDDTTVLYSVLIVPDGFIERDNLYVRIIEIQEEQTGDFYEPPGKLGIVTTVNIPNFFEISEKDSEFTSDYEGNLESYLIVPSGKSLNIEYGVWSVKGKSGRADVYITKRITT